MVHLIIYNKASLSLHSSGDQILKTLFCRNSLKEAAAKRGFPCIVLLQPLPDTNRKYIDFLHPMAF